MGVRYREFRRAGAPSQTAAALGEAPAPKGRLWLVPTAETSWKCGSIGKAARWAQGAAEIGAAQSGSSVPAEPLSGGPVLSQHCFSELSGLGKGNGPARPQQSSIVPCGAEPENGQINRL